MGKLTIRNLDKAYKELVVYCNFSIDFEENRVTCLVGPSGCGKTTLLNIIGGTAKPDSGQLQGFAGKRVSCVFQEPRLLPWKTVQGNVEFVLKSIMPREERRAVAAKFLELVELTEFAAYYPKALSGGMKQRAALARAFAYPAQLLLMDEPFRGLDLQLKLTMIKAFRELWRRNPRTVLFVTHDVEEALLLGEVIYMLEGPPVKIENCYEVDLPEEKRYPEEEAFLAQKKEVLSLMRKEP